MNIHPEDLILYAVTDRQWLGAQSLENQVEKAIKGGATMVQLREKELSEEEFEKEALAVQKVCKSYGIPFVINDNIALAKRIDADGVHLGQDDMETESARAFLGANKILGVTAKTLEQARKAESAGADYLGSGAVFHTGTKSDAKDLDHELFQRICESVDIPVVAIGGITAENVAVLKGRKMAGIAVVSGIFANQDIEKGTEQLKNLVLEIL